MTSPASRIKSLTGKAIRISLVAVVFMVMAGTGAYLSITLLFKPADTVIVPDLVGGEVLAALEILSDLGLNTRVKATTYHDQLPKNHVIDQDPEPGTAIKPGRDVKIRVSRGSERVVMPNLTGLSDQQGRILLMENGLCQGAVAQIPRLRESAGQIVAQYPSAGTTVLRNTCVDLLISQDAARPTFAMVDLTGLSLERAIRHLEQLRLTVGGIHITHANHAPAHSVINQVPLPGHRVAHGSRVDLTVNRSATDSHSDDPLRDNPARLFRWSLENGFLNQRVQVKISRPGLSISLLDDFFAPGEEIWLLIPNHVNSTLLVYVDGRLMETRIITGS